jgi:hypothetical protein
VTVATRAAQQFKSRDAVDYVVRLESNLYDVRGSDGESFIYLVKIIRHAVEKVMRNDDVRPVG